MSNKPPLTLISSTLLVCSILAASGCKRPTPAIGTGDEWRSWSASKREQYLVGYVEGHLAGTSQACKLADDRAEQDGKTLYVDHFPSRRCQDAAPQYTQVHITSEDKATGRRRSLDLSAYVNVLDTFYAHSECRMMPYEIILQHLNDKEYKSGDDLYKFVRSGPGWGTFSGFDGIEKCLPGYSK